MQRVGHWSIAVVVMATFTAWASAEEKPSEIFTRRILPLAKADKPSSCSECHAAGVDLSQYILRDAASTFAALRSAGLVDAEHPEQSKLLEFIARAPEKPDPSLAKLRSEELEAFRIWISATAKDSKLVNAASTVDSIGPTIPKEIIRHARRDRILESFVENIWVERERCAGCHSPDKNSRLIEKHGEHISWIKPNDPAGTLATIVEHGLINVDDPDKSTILQKPLGEVEHGGHIKFSRGTRTDKQFRRFLHDYSRTVEGKYSTVASLPKQSEQVVAATAQHLRITDLPAKYPSKVTRVDLYRWMGSDWSDAPVATVDGTINPKNGLFQGVVFAFLPRMPDLAKEVEARRNLASGRYLARVYVDRDDNANRNRDYQMGASDFVCEIEFDGPWPAGYSPPKILKAPATVTSATH